MRWNTNDWIAGLAAVLAAVIVYVLALNYWQAGQLRPEMQRKQAESILGVPPGEPWGGGYCIALNTPEDVKERTREAIHTERHIYSSPMQVIEIEYGGYRDQRIKSVTIQHGLNLPDLAYFIAGLLFAVAAELSRFICRRFATPPLPPPA